MIQFQVSQRLGITKRQMRDNLFGTYRLPRARVKMFLPCVKIVESISCYNKLVCVCGWIDVELL